MTRVRAHIAALAGRVREGVRGGGAYVALLLFVVIPLAWMAASMAVRSGLFGFSGTPAPDQMRVFLTFVGGALATAATVFATLLTREHNARERRRLRLETVVKSLESLPAEAARPRVAGVLSTMVLLGQERIAVRVLQPAWDGDQVDDGTATWLIGQVLTGNGVGDRADGDRTDEAAINEAAVLLAHRAERLTDAATGRYYFPGHFVRRWRTGRELPGRAKDNLLLAMGQMLVSQDRAWWSPDGDPPEWPTRILLECAEEEPEPVVRASAAVLLDALRDCFPDRFAAHLSAERLAAIGELAGAAGEASSVPAEYLVLAKRIRDDWGSSPPACSHGGRGSRLQRFCDVRRYRREFAPISRERCIGGVNNKRRSMTRIEGVPRSRASVGGGVSAMLQASERSRWRRVALRAVLCAAVAFPAFPAFPPLASSATAQELCQPRAGASSKECFVSTAGNDANPGTMAAPFRTVTRGVSVLQAGDVLSLRGGVHVQPETLRIQALHGTATAPIVIRSAPGEHAYIDGGAPEFRRVGNADWEPVPGHEGEYVSRRTFTDHIRGVFLDRNPYTRLITYSNLNDFRARNETFDKITLPVCAPGQQDGCDPRPGPEVVEDECSTPPCAPKGYRHPWVYMGPGIWIDPAVSAANPRKVHIRLSHTHNNVPGRPDYTGEIDPRRLALGITQEDQQALFIAGSSHLRFENLSIRQGGDYTVLMSGAATTNVTFDHVRLFATTHGVRMGQVSDTTFQNGEFNGGTPTWLFRSDQKNQYTYLQNGVPVVNNLGNRTSRALVVPSGNDARTTIKNCEFVNGHDLYLAGRDVVFHHNWINNLNDEGLFLDSADSPNMRVHQNVIVRTLSPISFAGGRAGGHQYLYRNLVDVRAPTAGFRPKFTGDVDIWRHGNTFKSNSPDGPYDVFQNTFLVYAQRGQASYLHYRNMQDLNARRSFNNIFVAVNPDADSDVPITFLPAPSFPAQTDGNDYRRIGQATTPRYRYLGYEFPEGTGFRAGTFDCLRDCPRPLIGSVLFQQSQTQYPPGYEANSIEADPQFIRLGPDGRFRDGDDLRLSATSPARAAGVRLPGDLRALDGQIIPPRAGAPDIGAYPLGAAPLTVGVDGRRSYPTAP